MIDLVVFARFCETLGTILIGITALSVHHKVLYEKKIDRKVVRLMRLEQKIGLLGILLILIGFSIEVFFL